MRFLFFFTILLASCSCFKAFSQDSATYEWNNRIVLLKDDQIESDWLRAQLKRLQGNTDALKEREVTLFLVADSLVYDQNKMITPLNAKTIIDSYELANFTGLILIEQDGSKIMQQEFIVNPQSLFDRIDRIPPLKKETSAVRAID